MSEHTRIWPSQQGPGPNADRRNVHVRRGGLGDVRRYGFEDDREGAGFLEGGGIAEQRIDLLRSCGLSDESAYLVDRLRKQSEMGHHGYADVHEPLDDVQHRTAPFQLHGRRAAILQQTAGVPHSLGRTDLGR